MARLNPVDIPNIRQNTPSDVELARQLCEDEINREVDNLSTADQLQRLIEQYMSDIHVLKSSLHNLYVNVDEEEDG